MGGPKKNKIFLAFAAERCYIELLGELYSMLLRKLRRGMALKLPEKKQVVVRLLPADAALLKSIATAEGVHMSTLVTTWIREKGGRVRGGRGKRVISAA